MDTKTILNNYRKENKYSKWKDCMKEITGNGGAVFSNKALRKFFKENHCKDVKDKSYIELADVYGQIISQGEYFEKIDPLEGERYIYIPIKFIADELSISSRRVSKLIEVLVKYELLEVKKAHGYSNRYKPNFGKLTELTKGVKFKYRKYENDRWLFKMEYYAQVRREKPDPDLYPDDDILSL